MIIAAMLLASAPAAPSAVTTIYVDQRDQCGVSRIAYDAQARSMKVAQRLKADLEAQGKRVTIIRMLPGMVIDRSARALIIDPSC